MLTDKELIIKLENGEDSFVERKVTSDNQDFTKTIVGFANTCHTDIPGILFVGIKDNGDFEISDQSHNFDKTQQKITKAINNIYPPLQVDQRELKTEKGKCLAIIVPGSRNKPHFSGPAYIRKGSETFKANEMCFNELISQRESKIYELSKWQNQEITLRQHKHTDNWRKTASVSEPFNIIDSCNQHYLTLRNAKDKKRSIRLYEIDICFDHEGNRLEVYI